MKAALLTLLLLAAGPDYEDPRIAFEVPRTSPVFRFTGPEIGEGTRVDFDVESFPEELANYNVLETPRFDFVMSISQGSHGFKSVEVKADGLVRVINGPNSEGKGLKVTFRLSDEEWETFAEALRTTPLHKLQKWPSIAMLDGTMAFIVLADHQHEKVYKFSNYYPYTTRQVTEVVRKYILKPHLSNYPFSDGHFHAVQVDREECRILFKRYILKTNEK